MHAAICMLLQFCQEKGVLRKVILKELCSAYIHVLEQIHTLLEYCSKMWEKNPSNSFQLLIVSRT